MAFDCHLEHPHSLKLFDQDRKWKYLGTLESSAKMLV